MAMMLRSTVARLVRLKALNTQTVRNVSIDNGKSKIYEFRQYWLKPSGVSSFMKLFEEFAPTRLKHSELLGYWTVELGGINQVVHIWEYDSFEQRSNVRAALAKDEQWVQGFVKNAFPYLDKQENAVLYGADWCDIQKDKAMSGSFELASYGMKVGGPAVWGSQLKASLLAHARQGYCDLIGVWYTDTGDHNQVKVVWRYDSFDARREGKNMAHEDSVLVNKMRDNLKNVTRTMPDIKIVPLGAGQDVGRSCILVTLGGKNIMLDCGMHMGFNDDRRFPDFSYITGGKGTLTEYIDCVIISHFHLDHCGALPYMSEMVGFEGPIYMTHPTKAIAPILLEDYRKITVDKKGEVNFFTSQMIKDCLKKVVAVNLHQTVFVDDELQIKAYYAGHVLGAGMFYIRAGTESVLYTGDYNMTPDRHLGAAWVDKCRPTLLITESTYATTIRDSKRCRERDFLKKVHETIERGGKVLIPVFALGRAQELCILLESYWDRMNLKVPIYFSTGLTEKATNYYKLFITWTNQKIKNTFVDRNLFEFKHIKPFNRATIDNPGAMVVFATPGMLHGGLSLEIFKKWCTSEKNTIIMPGYCVAGTVGHKILSGMRKIELQPGKIVEIKMQVQYMSFSAHADAKGIMQLIRMCEPENVMLVHGEAKKMEFLKSKIKQELNLDCFNPANGETVVISSRPSLPVDMSLKLLKHKTEIGDSASPTPKCSRIIHGALLMKDSKIRLLEQEEALQELGLPKHELRFTSTVMLQNACRSEKLTMTRLHDHLKKLLSTHSVKMTSDGHILIESVLVKAQKNAESTTESDGDDSSIATKSILVSWSYEDEDLGSYLMETLKNGLPPPTIKAK